MTETAFKALQEAATVMAKRLEIYLIAWGGFEKPLSDILSQVQQLWRTT